MEKAALQYSRCRGSGVVTVAARATLSQPSIALRFRRLAVDAEPATGMALLGGRLLGTPTSVSASVSDNGDVQVVAAPLLQPGTAMLDAWFGGNALTRGSHGCVRFVTDGCWLHGTAEIDDRCIDGGLHAASHRLYRDIFEVLSGSATRQLLRVWNYIADINAEADALERYRHFNAGRQQAFFDAGRSAFENSPTACALGTAAGPLRVSFLAGRVAPLAIENPRQVSAYRYPDDYGPRAPSFSRAALVALGDGVEALFISGTASIVGHASMHLGDVRRQTAECLANIEAILELARSRSGRRFDVRDLVCTVYVRSASDLAAVREVFEHHLGPASPAVRTAVYLLADVCRAELLVEIEAHGFSSDKDMIPQPGGSQ